MDNQLIKMKRYRYMALLLVVFLTGFLCACGKKPPVEIPGSDEQDHEKSEGNLKDRLGVPDEVTYQLQTGTTITLDVDMPDVSSVGIYELEAVELTTDYMEDICKQFFEKGEYQILWPSYIYTKEELEKRYETVSEEIEAWADDTMQSYILLNDYIDLQERIENYWDEWKPYAVSEPGSHLVLYPSPYIEIDDVNWKLVDWAGGNYFDAYQYVMAKGSVNGRDARVNFIHNSLDDNSHIRLYIDRDCRDAYTEFSKERAAVFRVEQAYVYTEEEAAKMALEYVEMLGLGDMQLINTNYLMEFDHTVPNENFYDGVCTGYRFTFGLSRNGLSMMYDPEYKGIVTVDIGAEGINGIYSRAPYRIVSTLAEESELLSFDKISEVAELWMAEQPENASVMNRVEFGYEVVSYVEGDALMPVWRYQWEIPGLNAYESVSLLTINAVDGSLVEDENVYDADTTYFPGRFIYSND